VLAGKVDITTKLKSQPLETQRLLWVSEIQGLQVTVILDRERQARTSVCHIQDETGSCMLLLALKIQGLQFTVIWDRERQAITVVSQSGRDGTLHVAELNSVVSTDEASATILKWL